ncbi:cation:proton antiporter domain-containing protein, partial [Breznakiellaceae bacterium SP9]
WVLAELLLFVLVGATLNIHYAVMAGFSVIALIGLALLTRICGVFVCVLKTPLTIKERLFCATAYLPKATVQAAIGSIPLTQGLASGSIILTAAVIAILVTAPIGGFLIDISYRKLLEKVQCAYGHKSTYNSKI